MAAAQVVAVDSTRGGVELRLAGMDSRTPPEPSLALVGVGTVAESGNRQILGPSQVNCAAEYPTPAPGPTAVPGVTPGPTPTPYHSISVQNRDVVSLVGCSALAATTGRVTLHNPAGLELAAHELALAVPPAPPVFGREHFTRRVCVDDATAQGDYFNGGERVGAAITATGEGGQLSNPAYTLLGVGDSLDYVLVAVDGNGQLTISEAGANGSTGLAADRLYSLTLQVLDQGNAARTTIAVQVDLAVSPSGDGGCP